MLDACVLVPYQLSDLLLRLADADLFEPMWSKQILEVERNAIKLGIPGEPIPIEVADEDAAWKAFFPRGEPTSYSPRGAAYLGWQALLDKKKFGRVLHQLTAHPALWQEFDEAATMLAGLGLMQIIERCPGDDGIKYAVFMPDVEHAMRGFGDSPVPVENAKILTLVLGDDRLWRVWGLHENYFPPASEVRTN